MTAQAQTLWLGERSEYRITDFDGRLRRCHVLGRLAPEAADSGDATDRATSTTLLWVRLDPPLDLEYDRLEEVVLQARHVGYDVDRLGDDSISVYVFEIRSREGFNRGRFVAGALHLRAWADVAREPTFLPETQEAGFDRTFELLRHYAKREGGANVPPDHLEGGVSLGHWVANMKRSQARGELRADWTQRLAALPDWRWGVDADRAWASAWKVLPIMWLLPPGEPASTELDRRLRMCNAIGAAPPIDDPRGGSSLWAYVYPPLRIESDEPGMVVITAKDPDADLRAFDADTVIPVEVSHIRSWTRQADRSRQPDEIVDLGTAAVAHDPASLPPMSEAEWQAGMAAMRIYREEIGHCWVPFDYVPKGDHDSDVHLGGWALRVRSEQRRGTLPPQRARTLESIPGWQWTAIGQD
jgi:hypothetical protein